MQIQIGADETAAEQAKRLIQKFTDDDIHKPLKKYLKSYTSDGASVVAGNKQSVYTLLVAEFGPHIYQTKCSAHRYLPKSILSRVYLFYVTTLQNRISYQECIQKKDKRLGKF